VDSSHGTDWLLSARWAGLALPLLCAVAWAQEATPPDAAKPAATAIARAAADRCLTRGTLDACDDAIRWNPRDPALLVAMGDAQMRAKRPADAVRAYARAATLAPDTAGIQHKISAAEASAKAKSQPNQNAATGKRYSNSDPDSQSH
jgi:cytochrome c-type biogenesis protein CcmH/NrfG